MAKSFHVLLLILALHVLKSALANKFSSLSLADECSLLFQFKESMSIANSSSSHPHAYPKVASWNFNVSDGATNCCLWNGVECRFGHVIRLDLSSSFLSGPISSNNSLLNLIHLHTLNLADNDFRYSKIPSGIGRLSQLEALNLSHSFFSGEVTKHISHLRNLVSLDLTGNAQLKLQCSDFQNLVRNSSETLRELFLSGVNIDSEIPCNLVNSSLLTSLVMRYCGLGGDFPTGIFNQLTGYIPDSIQNLTHLNILNIRFCAFTGTLPASVSNLTRLTVLDLAGNKFTGSIPSLECFQNLTHLSLSENKFDRWKLPDWLGKLKKITCLYLIHINLYGDIPSSFFNLTQVKDLYLSSNQLNGQLPSSLLNFQNLESFNFNDNNITVEFQLFLSLKKLKYLDPSGNSISLPVIDSDTNENQPRFVGLWLASCNLKVFPEFLWFQDQLWYLGLDNNNIKGLIPGWIENISKETLIELSLTHNLLTGFEQHSPVVPWVNLQILDLGHNMLTREIPPFIGDLLSLRLLNLSFNNITGSVPQCLEKLSNSLVVLNLRSNSLQGTIFQHIQQ